MFKLLLSNKKGNTWSLSHLIIIFVKYNWIKSLWYFFKDDIKSIWAFLKKVGSFINNNATLSNLLISFLIENNILFLNSLSFIIFSVISLWYFWFSLSFILFLNT